MRCQALITLGLVQLCYSAATADAPSTTRLQSNSATLLDRALQERDSDKPARPIGACIFFCGDQLFEIERCTDGDCPVFDCNSRTKQCPVRQVTPQALTANSRLASWSADLL